jgi:hypothetical protein
MHAASEKSNSISSVADNSSRPRTSCPDGGGRRRILFGFVAVGIAIALLVVARQLILSDLGWNTTAAASPTNGNLDLNRGQDTKGQVHEHPLKAGLALADEVTKYIDVNVHDYTATLIKQERIGNEVRPAEICYVKIRNQPLSVYMKFLAPENLKGQEVIWVDGANDNKLIGHAGSGPMALLGSKWLPIRGPIAMLGQHYPISEMGIANLTRRLKEVGQHDIQFGECSVWRDENAMVGDRPAICLTVEHPVRRKEFLFHIARIFIDKELNVPIRYEAYDWPDKSGNPPQLIESYTYTNLKLNPGLTDADFDPKNPEYNFGVK